ncbi:hypothetical protein GCK32_000588, partial [Trichostrongylus colubriformis]
LYVHLKIPAVAIQVILNDTIPEDAHIELRFDYALLLEHGRGHDRRFGCARNEQSECKSQAIYRLLAPYTVAIFPRMPTELVFKIDLFDDDAPFNLDYFTHLREMVTEQ